MQKRSAANVHLLGGGAAVVMERGDILPVDYGLTALGLNIVAALGQVQRFQDLVLAEVRVGRSGNPALTASLAAMRKADIRGTLYSHPIGDRGPAQDS